jgi:hypothetical protein
MDTPAKWLNGCDRAEGEAAIGVVGVGSVDGSKGSTLFACGG